MLQVELSNPYTGLTLYFGPFTRIELDQDLLRVNETHSILCYHFEGSWSFEPDRDLIERDPDTYNEWVGYSFQHLTIEPWVTVDTPDHRAQ